VSPMAETMFGTTEVGTPDSFRNLINGSIKP